MFWGRDQQDPVITPDKIEFTMGWVRKHVKLTKVLYTGMWHGINQQEIGHVGGVPHARGAQRQEVGPDDGGGRRAPPGG